MSEITLNEKNFESEVLNSDIPVLVDFWATWCGPCQMVAPVIAEIAKEKEGVIKVGKINVDNEPVLATKFGVMSIPTLILFKDGKPQKTLVGYRPKADIEAML